MRLIIDNLPKHYAKSLLKLVGEPCTAHISNDEPISVEFFGAKACIAYTKILEVESKDVIAFLGGDGE